MTDQQNRCVKAEERGKILVLTIAEPHVEGDAVAEELRQAMLQLIDGSPCRHAVIDFQHVRFISSVAFRPLLALRRALVNRGGRVVVCGLNPVIGDVFITTRMIDPEGNMSPMFDMQPDAAQSVAYLEQLDPTSREQP